MSTKKILIIGGSGFIGSSLAGLLFKKNEFSFTILDKVQSSLFPSYSIIGDIRSQINISENESFDSIINLAAEHRDDIYPSILYDQVNVDGARNVCKFASSRNINKIIFTSSVAVYGFAKPGTSESGAILPFNHYGRTKYEAEQIYIRWQNDDPSNRTLIIVRPTVVFGENNRGNVFNLFKQISSGKFIMIGDGLNRKSLAYVDNVSSFIEYSLFSKSGLHIYNYVDKPDLNMNTLVSLVQKILGKSSGVDFRIPFFIGLFIGYFFDFLGKISGKKFNISSIRIKKFCSNSVYTSAVELTDFIAPVPLIEGIEKTVCYEFIENRINDHNVDS